MTNNLRYADNTALIADRLKDIQRLINSVVEAKENRGLTVNAGKTNFMMIAKTQRGNVVVKDG